MRILVCSLVLFLLAGAAIAQTPTPSVFIVTTSKSDRPAKPGASSNEATGVAGWLQTKVERAIREKYPCISYLDAEGSAAILKWEHDRQLVGGTSESMDLSNMAGAMGARYLIVLDVTEFGGHVSARAQALDTKAVKPVAMRDTHSGTGDQALDAAESLATAFTNDLAGIFGGRCERLSFNLVMNARFENGDHKETIHVEATYEPLKNRRFNCTRSIGSGERCGFLVAAWGGKALGKSADGAAEAQDSGKVTSVAAELVRAPKGATRLSPTTSSPGARTMAVLTKPILRTT